MPVKEIAPPDPRVVKLERVQFGQDRFKVVRGVPLFAEHDTEDSKGRPQHYDRRALEEIIACCNRRIRETGDWAPLTRGHTPDREMILHGHQYPEVLGFCGNFRLGVVGEENPRYAILCDEYQFADKTTEIQRLPRRSVEVWAGDRPMSERFFDPVACLGSETPRLDLGIRFCRAADGGQVEKYSAPAMPASGNVFTKSFGGRSKKDRYGADDQTPPEGTKMLGDEELRQILEAINGLDFVQWARGKMEEDAGAPMGDEGLDEASPEDGLEDGLGGPEAAPPPAPEGPPAGPPMDAGPPPEAAGAAMPPPQPGAPPALAPEEDEEALYAAPAGAEQYVRLTVKERQAERSKYAKQQHAYEQLQAAHEDLRKKHGVMLREAADQARTAQINQLSMQYALDADSELDRVLYSRGSKMDNAGFREHVATIKRLASPSPIGHGVPHGRLSEPASQSKEEVAKYERARDYADQQRRAGRVITYEEALAHVEGKG